MGSGAKSSTIDDLRQSLEMANASYHTPEERASNRAKTLEAGLSMTPVIGNAMSAADIPDAYADAKDAFARNDWWGTAGHTARGALDTVGAVTGLPFSKAAGRAAKGGADRLNIFVGPEARTADKVALAQAEKLKTSGADRDKVWNETGWGWDPRGRPYFEVDDSAARINPAMGATSSGYGKNVVEHPELYATGYVPGKMSLREGEPRGMFSALDNSIAVQAPDKAAQRSIALHEMQHGVDNERGSGHGASYMFPHAEDVADARSVVDQTYGNIRAKMRDAQRRADALWDAGDAAGAQAAHKEVMLGYEELDKLREAGISSSAHDLAYARNDAEVRARNVETRKDMTAAERRAKAPWYTQDVADEDQFVRSKNERRRK